MQKIMRADDSGGFDRAQCCGRKGDVQKGMEIHIRQRTMKKELEKRPVRMKYWHIRLAGR